MGLFLLCIYPHPFISYVYFQLSQKMINLGGTGHVGKVKLIYQDSQSKLTLFQMDFDVSDMFDLELDGPGIDALADEMSCNPSTSEHFLTRLRISIDAEVQQNCQPVLWHSNLLNSSSDQFEQQREVVEKQVGDRFSTLKNVELLYEVCLFTCVIHWCFPCFRTSLVRSAGIQFSVCQMRTHMLLSLLFL
ncbi:hypothetical protein D915_004809 [Fasciola hepatica]|uniref:Uncharacterized protein n=1 Tax=Fasciola hepatica TaxID=6192 RepID=A0A4E0R9R2_FASHE|nr:hypothetical protein D915_004809 [Fasciola hepatica]